MNEQIQTWLATQLEKASTAVDVAAGFAAEQLPLFVQEFLVFKTVWHWAMSVVLLLIVLAVFIGVHVAIKRGRAANRYDQPWRLFYLLYLFNCIPLGMMFEQLYYATMVTFAPRVFLITQFMVFFK